jgi:hypothetical protein
MDAFFLQLLNAFFFVFHTVFTVFNLVGWLFAKTRKLHLLTVSLTALSWFGAGFWYGWGYCFCTDWHWQVREAMGLYDQSASYIHFLILKTTGLNLNPRWVDIGTAVGFAIAVTGSAFVHVRKCGGVFKM